MTESERDKIICYIVATNDIIRKKLAFLQVQICFVIALSIAILIVRLYL